VDHRRPIGAFNNVHNALKTEEIVAAVLGKRFEKEISATARIVPGAQSHRLESASCGCARVHGFFR